MIDVSAVIHDLNGKPVITSPKSKEELTLKKVLVMAISSGEEPQKRLSADEVASRHTLIWKIQAAEKSVKLKAEDVSLLKRLTAGLCSNIGLNITVAGEAIKLLDPIEEKKEEGDVVNG